MNRFSPFRVVLLVMLAVACVVPASAQTAAPTQGAGQAGVLAEQQKVLQDLTAKVNDLEKQIGKNKEDDDKLVDIRLKLEALSQEALHSALTFRPRLTEVNKRLEQLGPAPAEGQPAEPAIVANERQALTAEKAEINAVIASAQMLSVRISTLINTVVTTRSDLFRNLLTRRYALTDAFSGKVLSDAHAGVTSFYNSISSWLGFALKYKAQPMLLATMMALVAAFVLMFGGRRVFGRLINPTGNGEPSYLSRLSRTFWSTLLPTMALGVFFTTATLALAFNLTEAGLLNTSLAWPIAVAMAAAFAGMYLGQVLRARMEAETSRRWFLIAMLPLGVHLAGNMLTRTYA